MIDHGMVRELLELAAVEPGGIERVSAGDTPEAAAVAGHLAGCAACAEEARRLTTLAPIVRDAVETIPPDALRPRTLAFVRAVGRSRAAAPSAAVASRPRWPIAIATILVVSLVTGGVLIGVRLSQDIRDQQDQSAGLVQLSTATLRVTAEPDATRVALAGRDPATLGALVFSPRSQELVMTATGLSQPASGRVYACWVTRSDGSRARMGRMLFGAGLAYWAGWFDGLADAGPGTTFGVTLVGSDGKPIDPGDVLSGTVSSE